MNILDSGYVGWKGPPESLVPSLTQVGLSPTLDPGGHDCLAEALKFFRNGDPPPQWEPVPRLHHPPGQGVFPNV